MRPIILILLIVGLVVGVVLTPATALAIFGIDPGKVFIDNLHPGAQADVPITVFNHNDQETTFQARAKNPNYTAEGYESLPYLEWVTTNPEKITIPPESTGEVIVVVAMPDDAKYSGKKTEVWVSFIEIGTTGIIQIELCSRFLISTRVEDENTTPAVGSGAVGIIAEAGKEGLASPLFPWAILSSALGAVLIAGAIFFLVKRRQQA